MRAETYTDPVLFVDQVREKQRFRIRTLGKPHDRERLNPVDTLRLPDEMRSCSLTKGE